MLRTLFTRVRQPEAPPPWTSFSALQTVIVSYMTVIVGTVLAVMVFGQQRFSLLLGWTLAGALTLVFVWFTRRSPQERAALRLGPTNNTSLLLVALLCLGIAMALDVLRRYQPVPELMNFTRTPGEWLFAGLFMLMVQPIAEEVVFRGVMYPALRVTLGAWTGVLATILAHALFHFLAYSSADMNIDAIWLTLALPYIDALVLTLVRAYTGSTRAAIVGHMAFGLFAMVKVITLG